MNAKQEILESLENGKHMPAHAEDEFARKVRCRRVVVDP